MIKKCIGSLIVLIFSLLIVNVYAESEINVPEDFVVYYIYYDELEEMVNINANVQEFFKSKDRTEYHFKNLIDCYEINEILYDDKTEIIYSDNFLIFPGEKMDVGIIGFSFPVEQSPFQSDVIDTMLQKNEITDEVIEYYIFTVYESGYYYRLPKVMIWARTSEQVYILGSVFEDNEGRKEHQFADYSDNLCIGLAYGTEPYGFKAYTIDEVREEFLPRSFDVRINCQLQEKDENICLIEDRGYIPISFLEKLGIEAEYNSNEEELYLKYANGDKKVIYMGESYVPSRYDTYDDIGLSYRIIEKNLYISIYDFEKIINDIGHTVSVNEHDRIIDITKIPVVYLDDQQIIFDMFPITENDRTLVPMRTIFEALGAEVKWDDETNTATAEKNGVTVSVTINSDTMLKNGEAIKLDAPARLIDDSRTFVPLRAVSEAFDCTVEWSEELQRVDILS